MVAVSIMTPVNKTLCCIWMTRLFKLLFIQELKQNFNCINKLL